MNVSLGDRWERFVASAVEEGRYGSASDIVREGLRLVEERDVKLGALRKTLNDAVAKGGSHSDENVAAAIEALLIPHAHGIKTA